MTPEYVIERVSPGHARALASLFQALREAGDDETFHPHELTASAAATIASYRGADVYAIARAGDAAIAYGMLRGWEAGFAVPSLGLAVHPSFRNRGVARALASWLHDRARAVGARSIRLRVYPDNDAALRLYDTLGYRFDSTIEDGQLVGVLDLREREMSAPCS